MAKVFLEQRKSHPKTDSWSIHGVSVADRLFAGPQFTNVQSPTAFPRTRSGMISGMYSQAP